MAQKLDSVSCGDGFTDAATITDVYGCQGGYFAVSGNDAFIQVQYGALGGGTQWSDAFHAPVGNGQLTAGTIGVRFRNYVAGSVAVVSAGLFYPKQPWFALSSSGNATPSSSTVMVTGLIPAAGTTPTSGTGFTYTHTNGTGVYVFTYTPPTPFATAPVVVVTPVAAIRFVDVNPQSTTGFTVSLFDASSTPADSAFDFAALTVV